METVGFIGLGRIGAPMAGNIQKAGYPIVAYDVRPEAAKPLVDGGAVWPVHRPRWPLSVRLLLPPCQGPKKWRKWPPGPVAYLRGSGAASTLTSPRAGLLSYGDLSPPSGAWEQW